MPDHKNIAEALLAVQLEAPNLPRNGTAQYGSYVTLDDLIAAMRPILNKHGVVLTQLPATVDGRPALCTSLIHAASSTEVKGTMPLVLQREDPQGVGGALTYYRRYGIQGALGLACESDDDARSVSAPVPARSGRSGNHTPPNSGRQASNGRAPV